ncbi:hypothetical protein I317_00970 [Kwoniella heveanensis CBS 569]|nr:hypothetical protein I317_00970 [Kwoniella heveanensis CBS 569]
MTTTAGPSHQRHSPHPIAPSYGHYRHHPYAPPQAQAPAAQKSNNGNSQPRVNGRDGMRAKRPVLASGVAFGGNNGGKWWDEELPPPPASLSSILDSFRKSGEGDRDLLLSILGAKKAEEERLTALIQTRLTILQARLSLHSAAASLSAMPMVQAPSTDRSLSEHAMNADTSAHGSPNDHINEGSMAPPPVERTPSLTSSRGPGSTSDGIASPPLPNGAAYMPPPYPAFEKEVHSRERERSEGRGYWQLSSLQSSLRPPHSHHSASRSPNSPSHTGLPLAPLREVRMDESSARDRRSAGHGPRANGRMDARSNGSVSPKSHVSDGSASGRRDRSGSGLEMLLDAGRVVNESSERDS